MAEESRTSTRTIQTAIASREVSSGSSRTRRINVDDTWITIIFAPKILRGTFHNDGNEDVRIRINNSGVNFYVLKPDRILEKISINGSTVEVSTDANPKTSTLRCIFEG